MHFTGGDSLDRRLRASSPIDETPHWEHGYRVHGLWVKGARVARISIGPRGLWDGLYSWELDLLPDQEKRVKSLRIAKREVERAILALDRKLPHPGSSGYDTVQAHHQVQAHLRSGQKLISY